MHRISPPLAALRCAQATISLLLPTAFLLFWRPCEQYGVAASAVTNVKAGLLDAARALGSSLG